MAIKVFSFFFSLFSFSFLFNSSSLISFFISFHYIRSLKPLDENLPHIFGFANKDNFRIQPPSYRTSPNEFQHDIEQNTFQILHQNHGYAFLLDLVLQHEFKLHPNKPQKVLGTWFFRDFSSILSCQNEIPQGYTLFNETLNLFSQFWTLDDETFTKSFLSPDLFLALDNLLKFFTLKDEKSNIGKLFRSIAGIAEEDESSLFRYLNHPEFKTHENFEKMMKSCFSFLDIKEIGNRLDTFNSILRFVGSLCYINPGLHCVLLNEPFPILFKRLHQKYIATSPQRNAYICIQIIIDQCQKSKSSQDIFLNTCLSTFNVVEKLLDSGLFSLERALREPIDHTHQSNRVQIILITISTCLECLCDCFKNTLLLSKALEAKMNMLRVLCNLYEFFFFFFFFFKYKF